MKKNIFCLPTSLWFLVLFILCALPGFYPVLSSFCLKGRCFLQVCWWWILSVFVCLKNSSFCLHDWKILLLGLGLWVFYFSDFPYVKDTVPLSFVWHCFFTILLSSLSMFLWPHLLSCFTLLTVGWGFLCAPCGLMSLAHSESPHSSPLQCSCSLWGQAPALIPCLADDCPCRRLTKGLFLQWDQSRS